MSATSDEIGALSNLLHELQEPYHLLSTGIALVALVVTVGGLWFAIIQVLRTRKAADAAKRASESTLGHIERLSALVEVAALCRLSNDLTHLMRQRSWTAAAMRAADLRAALAKVRESEGGRTLLTKGKWQEMLTQAKMIEDVLQAASIGKKDDEEVFRCLVVVADMHEILNTVAGRGMTRAQGGER